MGLQLLAGVVLQAGRSTVPLGQQGLQLALDFQALGIVEQGVGEQMDRLFAVTGLQDLTRFGEHGLPAGLGAEALQHVVGGATQGVVLLKAELLPDGHGFGELVEMHEGAGAVVEQPGVGEAGGEGGIEQGEGELRMAVVAGFDRVLEEGGGVGLEIEGGGIPEVAQGQGVLVGQLVKGVVEGKEELLPLELEHLLSGLHHGGVVVALELLPEGDGFRWSAQIHQGAGAVVLNPGAAVTGVEGGIEEGEGGGGLALLTQLDGGFQLAVQR
jgi:hypothetical protein